MQLLSQELLQDGSLKMKILAIGDPHGNLPKLKRIPIKGVDLIFLTGDIGKADLARKRFFENIEREKKGLKELEYGSKYRKAVHMEIHKSTLGVLKYLSKFAPVYTIQGNVGIPTLSRVKKDNKKYGLNLSSTRKEMDLMKKVKLVKNRLRILKELRIGFLEYFIDTCWVKEFKPSDYRKSMKKAKKETDKAKRVLKRFKKIDILICHQPPYGILDKVTWKEAPKHYQGKHAGSKVILDYIKKTQPKYVFCGHIHEGKAMRKIGKTEVYNLSVGGYKVVEF